MSAARRGQGGGSTGRELETERWRDQQRHMEKQAEGKTVTYTHSATETVRKIGDVARKRDRRDRQRDREAVGETEW